ncbi:MAG: hypothetical protein ACR2NL_10950 [Acidimicrobiia bacterium]
MSALERFEAANPVADADRLLSAPGAMDDFVLAVKQRSGIMHTTDDQAPIEVPTESSPIEIQKGPRDRRRLAPALVAAAVLAIVTAGIVFALAGSSEPDVANISPKVTFTGDACVYEGPAEFALDERVTFTFLNNSTDLAKFELWKVPDGTTAADISERGIFDVVLAVQEDLTWALGGDDQMPPGNQSMLTRNLGFEGQHAVVCLGNTERTNQTASFFMVASG